MPPPKKGDRLLLKAAPTSPFIELRILGCRGTSPKQPREDGDHGSSFEVEAVYVDEPGRGKTITISSEEFNHALGRGMLHHSPCSTSTSDRLFTAVSETSGNKESVIECILALHEHILRKKRTSPGGLYMLPFETTSSETSGKLWRLVHSDQKNNYFVAVDDQKDFRCASMEWSSKEKFKVPMHTAPVSECFRSFAFRLSIVTDFNALSGDARAIYSRLKELEAFGDNQKCRECRLLGKRLHDLEEKIRKPEPIKDLQCFSCVDEQEEGRIIQQAKAVLRKSSKDASLRDIDLIELVPPFQKANHGHLANLNELSFVSSDALSIPDEENQVQQIPEDQCRSTFLDEDTSDSINIGINIGISETTWNNPEGGFWSLDEIIEQMKTFQSGPLRDWLSLDGEEEPCIEAARCLFDICRRAVVEEWSKVGRVGAMTVDELPELAVEMTKEAIRYNWTCGPFMVSPDDMAKSSSRLRREFEQLLLEHGLEIFTAHPQLVGQCLARCYTLVGAAFFSKPPLTFNRINQSISVDFDPNRHVALDGVQSRCGKTRILFPSILETELPCLCTSVCLFGPSHE